MSDCISREKLLLALKEWQNTLIETYGKNDEYVKCLEIVLTGIEKAPAADVGPVKPGKWMYKMMTVPGGKGQTYAKWCCSKCKEKFKGRSNFCPNCGARMEES